MAARADPEGVSKKPSEPGKGNVCTMPMSIGRGFV